MLTHMGLFDKHSFKDVSVLDLFSGSGSIGIEALSRGANLAVFVDSSIECIQVSQLLLLCDIFYYVWTDSLYGAKDLPGER
jgi:16S rRNA G966 N2-methylase RsmD